MPEELTAAQKALIEQIFLDPATFNVAWAHHPFNAYWRTNNFIQRSLTYLFALDTSQKPHRWIPLEVDSEGRLEISAISGAVTNHIQAYDGVVWRNVRCDGTGNLQMGIASSLPPGNNNIGDVDVLTQPARTASTDSFLCYGFDGATNRKIKTDTEGNPQVNVVSSVLPSNAATESTLQNVVKKASTPTVYNVAMAAADTEYSQALPANTKKFLIKLRAANVMKVKFAPAGNYITIPAGSTYYEDNLDASITLYFESPVAGQTAEIVAWV